MQDYQTLIEYYQDKLLNESGESLQNIQLVYQAYVRMLDDNEAVMRELISSGEKTETSSVVKIHRKALNEAYQQIIVCAPIYANPAPQPLPKVDAPLPPRYKGMLCDISGKPSAKLKEKFEAQIDEFMTHDTRQTFRPFLICFFIVAVAVLVALYNSSSNYKYFGRDYEKTGLALVVISFILSFFRIFWDSNKVGDVIYQERRAYDDYVYEWDRYEDKTRAYEQYRSDEHARFIEYSRAQAKIANRNKFIDILKEVDR